MNTMAAASVNLQVNDAIVSWQSMSGATRDVLIILGAVLGVTLLALVWAIFLRRQTRRRHSHHRARHHSPESVQSPASPTDDAATLSPLKRRKRRRRSRDRPLNPTLAETGGLPPVRTQGPPEPSP